MGHHQWHPKTKKVVCCHDVIFNQMRMYRKLIMVDEMIRVDNKDLSQTHLVVTFMRGKANNSNC